MAENTIEAASDENLLAKKSKSKHIIAVSERSIGEKHYDHYAVGELDTQSLADEAAKTRSWSEMSQQQRTVHVLIIVGKWTLVISFLYIFICSLELLSVGLRIFGGRKPSSILENSSIKTNPVVGLMCGILFTIVVQSSSTTSSAVVGLVAGNFIPVESAIPIIMGANIGTSVTNTLIAMVQVDDRDRFRRAFAAATIHDMFNWLTTFILLPIESMTGYLYRTSTFLVRQIKIVEQDGKRKKLKLLKAFTEPVTKQIVKYNDISSLSEAPANHSFVAKEGTLFANSTWSDEAIGLVVVVGSFVVLLSCLFLIVKTLKSILKGKMAIWIRRTFNSNLPYCPWLTEYLLILMGAVLTFLVQSSSVFTSTLPPLVSVKAISLERAYPLTLGSNLGTTTTAIIAAMAQSKNVTEGLQIALCHFLFNLSGILMFFPVPFTRFPIGMSKTLGNTTAQYRWFAIFYVVILFVLLPLLFMMLAFAGSIYVIVAASIILICFMAVVVINYLRFYYPRFLPKIFHTWNWLPEWMRSLEPYDRLFSKLTCCLKLKRLSVNDNEYDGTNGAENKEEGAASQEDNAPPEDSTVPTVGAEGDAPRSTHTLASQRK